MNKAVINKGLKSFHHNLSQSIIEAIADATSCSGVEPLQYSNNKQKSENTLI